MKPVILTLLLVVLPYQLTTTKAFIDCRTSCRKCKEGLEDVNLLEIYCSMCKECRDRRRERMAQQKMPPGLGRPGPGGPRPGLEDFRSGPEGFQSRPEGFRPGAQRFHSGPGGFRPGPQGFRPGPENLRPEGRGASGFNRQSSLRTKTFYRSPNAIRMDSMNQAAAVQVNRMETWPEHCPTPPICEEEEPIELLTKTRTIPTTTMTTMTTMTTTTMTTTTTEPPTTTEPATCPPINTCRKKKTTTTGCIPCMPMCPAPCPAGPLIPSEIVVNINWNGKVPFEFLPTATEHEVLKFTKTKTTEPTTNDWIQNDPTEEPTTTSTTTTTTTSTTTSTTTTTTETVPITQTPFTIVETSPATPAAIISTVCPPQPYSSSNPCCYLPLAFQGQLNMLGINCDPQKQGLVFTTTMNPVTVATIPPFVLDEALIRKILINSNQNNNGNEHSVDGNNILSPEHGIMVESTNINENNNVNNEKGNHIKGREVLSFAQNNGVYDFNHKHGPSNSEFTDFQRKIVMNENPYNDKSLNRKIVINDRNGNGGSSNNAYDVQKQIVINKPNNDLKKQIAINQFNPDIDRKIEINADKKRDKQTSQAPCDKKTTNNQDQDYYYVYVGLPKNLAGSRRASTPVDLPVLDFPPPGVF